MAIRKVFTDETSKLEVYVNEDNNLYLEVGLLDGDEYSGFITLNLEDAEAFRSEIDNYINTIISNGKKGN